MSTWSTGPQPVPPQPSPPAALPGLRVPRTLLAVGLVLLGLAVALVVYSMTSRYTIDPNDDTLLPDGDAHLVLRADQDYGLYTADLKATCTVTDPAGEDVSVTPPSFDPYGAQPEILRFRTGQAGTYHVVCDASRDVVVNLSHDTAGFRRAQVLFWLSFPMAGIGVSLALTGGIWGGVRRARRRRLLLADLAARSGAAASTTAPWSAPWPVTGTEVRPLAGPGAPTGPGDGATPSAQAYGIAPRPVSYQPSSPGTGPQVLPPPGAGHPGPSAGSGPSWPATPST